MFEHYPEVPAQAYSHQTRIAIFRYDKNSYDAKIIDEFFALDQQFIVKDIKLNIPRSHIERVGKEYFRFLALAFKLMSKQNCCHPLAVLKPLRRKLHKIKRKLIQINPGDANTALCWYLACLYDTIKEMWSAARNNYVRFLCNQRTIRKDTELLNATHLY